MQTSSSIKYIQLLLPGQWDWRHPIPNTPLSSTEYPSTTCCYNPLYPKSGVINSKRHLCSHSRRECTFYIATRLGSQLNEIRPKSFAMFSIIAYHSLPHLKGKYWLTYWPDLCVVICYGVIAPEWTWATITTDNCMLPCAQQLEMYRDANVTDNLSRSMIRHKTS